MSFAGHVMKMLGMVLAKLDSLKEKRDRSAFFSPLTALPAGPEGEPYEDNVLRHLSVPANRREMIKKLLHTTHYVTVTRI